MSSIRVEHTLAGLERDLARIARTAKPDMARVVKRNVTQGGRAAQRIARQESGPHGLNYFKRITSEMTGTLSGEYGPTGKVDGNAVGAGWRHGSNLDLARSADVQIPRFVKDVHDLPDKWFW